MTFWIRNSLGCRSILMNVWITEVWMFWCGLWLISKLVCDLWGNEKRQYEQTSRNYLTGLHGSFMYVIILQLWGFKTQKQFSPYSYFFQFRELALMCYQSTIFKKFKTRLLGYLNIRTLASGHCFIQKEVNLWLSSIPFYICTKCPLCNHLL